MLLAFNAVYIIYDANNAHLAPYSSSDHQWVWSMNTSRLRMCIHCNVIEVNSVRSEVTVENVCFRIQRFLQNIHSSLYALARIIIKHKDA